MLLSLFLPVFFLDGAWLQPCTRGYQREELFAGQSVQLTERNYWDLSCSAPAVETISRGSVELGDSVFAPEGAFALDFTFASVSLKPVDERTAAVWRERGVCGFRDWEPGVEREVTGRECDFYGLGSVVKVPSAGDRRFGVVKPGADEIFFGRLSPARDGSSPERRPLELDLSPYRRVP